ncbi:MAG: FAD-binding oxidoreductase [Chloroflexota bacterium]
MVAELPRLPSLPALPARPETLPGLVPGRTPAPLPGRVPGAVPGATPGAVPGAARPAGFAPNAALVEREALTADLAHIRIRPDAGVPAFKPGQYVSIGLPGPSGPVIRPYSIASAPGTPDVIELLIRRLDDGALTTRLWAMAPGDRLWLGPVKGLFHLDPDHAPATPLLFLGAGTGLAPIMAMLGALAAQPAQRRPRATLIQGATHVDELAYQARLAAWAADGWLRYLPTISRPADPGNARWSGATGRVETHVRGALEAFGTSPARVTAYLCGNDGMVGAGRAALQVAGVPEAGIRWESFTPVKPAGRAA